MNQAILSKTVVWVRLLLLIQDATDFRNVLLVERARGSLCEAFQKRTGFIQMSVTSERGSEVVKGVEVRRIELNRALPGGHRRVGLSGLEGNDAQPGVRL